jgi:iron(III) transport system permease protein
VVQAAVAAEARDDDTATLSMPLRPAHLVALLIAAFFAIFFFYPLAHVLVVGVTDSDGSLSFFYIAAVFTNPAYRDGLVNAALIAVTVTALCLLIAVPPAFLANRFEFPFRRLFAGLLLVPMVLPPFVGVVGLRHLFARDGGPVNLVLWHLGILSAPEMDWFGEARFAGVVLVEALHLYPIVYLNVVAALANLDPAMEDAARSCGASGWTIFRRITLPPAMPGLFAGGTITFIWSFTELGAPLMFDYRQVTPVQVFDGLNQIGDSRHPFALAIVMLAAAVGVYAVSRLLLGRAAYATAPKATTAATQRPLSAAGKALVTAPFVIVIGLSLLPHVGVVLTSLAGRWYGTILPEPFSTEHYNSALVHPLTVPSITNSIRYSILATLLDLALGLAVAWLTVRGRVPAAWLLDAVAMMPLAVPGLVVAFGYMAAGQGGLLTPLDPRVNPTTLLVVAYAVRRLPYVVRSTTAGLQQTPEVLEEAAASCGAGPWTVLRRVTVPLIAANLIAGGLLAFSFSMLEVSDSLVLAGRQPDYPITKAIYELSTRLGDGPYIAAALGVWAMLLLALTLIAAAQLLGKRMGALFRA